MSWFLGMRFRLLSFFYVIVFRSWWLSDFVWMTFCFPFDNYSMIYRFRGRLELDIFSALINEATTGSLHFYF
jgi:hypothetical protein